MISFTERTILDRRTLGRICDHGTTECKDMITLCENNRGYCSVYVCNKGLQEILRLSAQNDEMNCHCERSEAIKFFGCGMRIFTGLPRHCVARNDGATKRFFGLHPLNDGSGLQEILRLSAQNDEMNCHCERSEAIQFLGRGMRILTGLPRKSDDFLAMTDNRNMIQTMHNDQNGLVVMFSSAKHHRAQETKPDRCRNMIRKEVA